MVSLLSSKSRRLAHAATLLAVAVGLSHSRVAAAGEYCLTTVTEDELAAGLQIGTDSRCPVSRATGCIDLLCRYCRWTDGVDAKYADYITCQQLAVETGPSTGDLLHEAPTDEPIPMDPTPVAPAPVAPPPVAPAPVAPPPVAPVPVIAPAPIGPPPRDTGCPFPVSEGNLAAGIQLVGDPTCATVGGVGCFEDVCRYCRFDAATATSTYLPCNSLGYNFGSAPAPAPLPAPVPVPGPAPVPAPAPVAAPAPVSPPTGGVSTLATGCPYPVASGDFDVGIQLVGDATCAKGGRGCYQNVCRFCKFRNTDKSKHMVTCASLGYAQFGNPGEAPVDGHNGCPYDVSEGDAAVGIDLVGDATCDGSGGVGCFEKVCRYCKVKETPQSSHLLKCADVVKASGAIQPGFRLAIKEASVRAAATSGDKFDALLKDKTFKWSLMGAACVGVVAAVALVALGAKRVISRRGRKPLVLGDVAAEETEEAAQAGKTDKSILTVVTTEDDSA